jgi:endogenous inhibitor of DNA gyrase (YacG/DUF329 family)
MTVHHGWAKKGGPLRGFFGNITTREQTKCSSVLIGAHWFRLALMVTLQCERCGRTFSQRPSRRNRRFCSRVCYHPGRKEQKCPRCGRLFVPKDSRKRTFCSHACIKIPNKRIPTPKVRRDKYTSTKGYVIVYSPDHPAANKNGYVFEHRLVVEAALGRLLEKGETVHHRNGLRTDNRVENLELWTGDHPSGQRVEDMIEFCKEFLARYQPEALR